MDDRKQDVWFVFTSYFNDHGRFVLCREGVLDLPHPMTAFDAADHAVRVEVRDVMPMLDPNRPGGITSEVWGKREAGRPDARYRMCTALAVYDPERGSYLRPEPWIAEDRRVPVGEDEVSVFHPVSWR